MTQLRGVNLGGWLLVEKWITPALFAGTKAVDEFTFMQTGNARAKLREHQKNFIREEDFRWMSQNGINAVRIPVGYWVLDGDEPFVPCVGKLDWAFRMAEKYHLAVLISLHGAPGSQNGKDNSGRIGQVLWVKNKAYREQTITILERLAARYGRSAALWGIELLNEPTTRLFQWRLRQFYNQAYRRLMCILPASVKIVFHDAFTPRLLSNAIATAPGRAAVMDIHWYQFVVPLFRRLPVRWYYRLILPSHRRLIHQLQKWQGVIIGEWSAVLATDTLKRYPQARHEEMMDEWAARQLKAYAASDGWFYWTYKTEGRGIWNFRSMIEDGRIQLG